MNGRNMMSKNVNILCELYDVIVMRKGADPKSSFTASLFSNGTNKIAQKLGEEAVETAIAAVAEGKHETISESADLLYCLLVLWADKGIKPDEVWERLAERSGISGITEKESRNKSV